jgi:hypothetical protein
VRLRTSHTDGLLTTVALAKEQSAPFSLLSADSLVNECKLVPMRPGKASFTFATGFLTLTSVSGITYAPECFRNHHPKKTCKEWSWPGDGRIFPLIVILQAVEYAKYLLDLEVRNGLGIRVSRVLVELQVLGIEIAQKMPLEFRTFQIFAKEPGLDRPVGIPGFCWAHSLPRSVRITRPSQVFDKLGFPFLLAAQDLGTVCKPLCVEIEYGGIFVLQRHHFAKADAGPIF